MQLILIFPNTRWFTMHLILKLGALACISLINLCIFHGMIFQVSFSRVAFLNLIFVKSNIRTKKTFLLVAFINILRWILIFLMKTLSLHFSAKFLGNKLLVIMGDFNINLLHYDESPPIANFLDFFGSYHMLPHISLPTRITSSSNTLIDNIFVSITSSPTISGNLTIGISDQPPTIFDPQSNVLTF